MCVCECECVCLVSLSVCVWVGMCVCVCVFVFGCVLYHVNSVPRQFGLKLTRYFYCLNILPI